ASPNSIDLKWHTESTQLEKSRAKLETENSNIKRDMLRCLAKIITFIYFARMPTELVICVESQMTFTSL
ncbi:hypothetical protein ACJX0J_034852, partial [Zea mays]